MLKGFLQFIRDALSEKGQPSFSRCAAGALVLGVLLLMLMTGKIPEHLSEVGVLIGVLYGVNQARAAVQAFGNRNHHPAPQVPDINERGNS